MEKHPFLKAGNESCERYWTYSGKAVIIYTSMTGAVCLQAGETCTGKSYE